MARMAHMIRKLLADGGIVQKGEGEMDETYLSSSKRLGEKGVQGKMKATIYFIILKPKLRGSEGKASFGHTRF